MTEPSLLTAAIQSILNRIPTGDQIEFMNMTEEQFTEGAHFSLGVNIRNDLGLWKPDSSLAAWFVSNGVIEADDMCDIILTCVYRKIMAREIDLKGQLEYFQE
ncbi:MAG TPA: DUF6794 domain-containing protein [Pedobacter sp.]|jgi:hypothetical protein